MPLAVVLVCTATTPRANPVGQARRAADPAVSPVTHEDASPAVSLHDERPHRLPVTPRARAPVASAPAADPSIGDGLVYLPLSSGVVVAHRITNGAEAWRVELVTTHAVATSDGLAFVVSGEAIHALRASDGSEAWRAATGAVGAPLLARQGWLVATTEHEVIALRAADGSIVWRQATAPLSDRPSIEGGHLYLPLSDGRVRALDLASGAERWTRRLGGTPTTVLPLADRVYVGSADRHFYCLDAGNGRIAWRFFVGAPMRGEPGYEGSLVFAVALDNLVRAFDRISGARRWHSGLPFRPSSGPLLAQSILTVAGPAERLPVFNTTDGARQAAIALGGVLAAPVALGRAGRDWVLAAVTGNPTSGWSLVLLDTSYSVPLAPLTALPGEVVPISIPPSK